MSTTTQKTIQKRNGKEAPFEASRIRKAIYGAFWDYLNEEAIKKGETGIVKSTALDVETEKEIDTITDLVVENCERKNLSKVEEVESAVEDAIWNRGHKNVSKLYIGYRQMHEKKRKETERKTKITITKSTGERALFEAEPIKDAIKAACIGIKDVSEKALYAEAENSLYDGVKTSEITEAMIQAARSFIEREPAYSYVAARLLLQKLADESLQELGFEYKSSQIPVPYEGYFQAAVKQGISEGLLNHELETYDLDKLAAAIVPERDLDLQYMGLKTLADRYFIKSRQSRARLEIPQNFFMRVAMGLALKEEDKNEKAIEFYNVLSQRLGMSSTPTLFNAGTPKSQLSSCFLSTVSDDIESIMLNGIANSGFLSKWAGGLGVDWTNVRGAGGYIKGTNGESNGVVPFLKIFNDTLVAVNQCWDGNTPIITPKGIKPISELKEGNLVLTETGEFSPIKEVVNFKQHGKPMVKIKAKHSEELFVTDEHPLWSATCINHGAPNMDWVEPKNLTTNDYLGTRIPTESLEIPEINTIDIKFYAMMLTKGLIISGEASIGSENKNDIEFIETYLQNAGVAIKKLTPTTFEDEYSIIKWKWSDSLKIKIDDIYNEKGKAHISGRMLMLPKNKALTLATALLSINHKIIECKAEANNDFQESTNVQLETDNLNLIRGVKYLLLKNGIPTSFSEEREVTNSENTPIVTIKKPTLHVPATKAIAEILETKETKTHNWLNYNGFIFTKIEKIEKIEPVEVVYDLIIDGPESYCTTDVLAHNGGKRRGAGCAYLETWHIDIEEFLELRKETGDDRRRCHDMNSANWIPDLFMKRVIEDGHWWLFSPDKTPDLHDLYGKAFEAKYKEYEKIAEAGAGVEHNDELGLVKKSKHANPLHPCKRVSAVAIWKKMLALLFETGHPWMTFKDPANIRNPQDHVGVIHSSNLCCVAGDQRVPSEHGIITVKELYENKTKNTFVGSSGLVKGSEMHLPKPQAELVEIVTKEGYTHKITPDHKVSTERGQVMAKDLVEGDKIHIQQHEGIWGKTNLPDLAFCAGFISSDGGVNDKTAYIDIWENKTLHLSEFVEEKVKKAINSQKNNFDYDEYPTGDASVASSKEPKFGNVTKPSVEKRRLMSAALKKALAHNNFTKEDLSIPEFVWRGNKETVSSYLLGIMLGDATFQADEVTTIGIASISKKWIKELQILLANFGIKSSINKLREAGKNTLPDGKGENKEYDVQECYRLLITSIKGCKILEKETSAAKLRNKSAFLKNLEKEGYEQKLNATFEKLNPAGIGDAFCPTVEAEDHLWTANGILTRNTEIFLNTSSSKINAETGEIKEIGETAVCNLLSINLVEHINDGKIDKVLLKKTVTTAMRMLDNVVDLNFYPTPETRKANTAHRPVGLGCMGVHTVLQKLNIPYDSQEAVALSDVAQELIALYAIEASADLAKEKGTYSTFKGSKWDRGILPLESLKLLIEERGEEYCTADTSCQYPQEWEKVKAKIKKYGMRNSNTMAIAPNACVAGDTLVLTNEGLTEIQSFNKNEEGEWQDLNIEAVQEKRTTHVTKFFKNGIKPTIKVTTDHGQEIIATGNHQLRVINEKGEYDWKRMDEIKPEDTVVKRLGGYEEVMFNKQELPLICENDKHFNDKTELPNTINEEIALLMGLYTGDGYIKDSKGKIDGVSIAQAWTDPDLKTKIEEIAEKYNINVSSEKRPGCNSLLLNSTRLAKAFKIAGAKKESGVNGEGLASAKIPHTILKSPPKIVYAFLRGLFESDGTITTQKIGSPVVEFSSTSETLAKQTQALLGAIGIKTSRCKSKPGTLGKRPIHRVRLMNVNQVKTFSEKIGFLSNRKKEILAIALKTTSDESYRGERITNKTIIRDVVETAIKHKIGQNKVAILWAYETAGSLNIKTFLEIVEKYPQFKETKLWNILQTGNIYFEKVETVEQNGEIETFDLSVPETVTYIANGFISHNTIALICGVSEGNQPDKAPIFRKENLSGSFPVVNPILIERLKDLRLWEGRTLEKIKLSEGSIQNIEEIPAEIRAVFKTCFEIHPAYLIECASRRQKWIDQGQSLNLFASQPNGQFLSSMYKLAWAKGLKSTYYLRSVSGSQKEKTSIEVQKIGSTLNIGAQKIVPKVNVNVNVNVTPSLKSVSKKDEEETCESCQ